jgi:hypothetical protein
METGRWSKSGTALDTQEAASPREPQPASPLNVPEGPSPATETEGGSVYSGRGEGESNKTGAVGGSSKLAATRALWLSCQHADPNVFSFLFYFVLWCIKLKLVWCMKVVYEVVVPPVLACRLLELLRLVVYALTLLLLVA